MSRDPFALSELEANPPQLESLRNAVRVRRGRRFVRTGIAGGVMLAALMSIQYATTFPVLDDDRQIASAPTTEPLPVQESGPPLSDEAPFRVFAEINTKLPVFAFDEAQNGLVPVGWVQASDVMPVELGPLSNEQVDMFQSVLHNDPQPQFISL